MKDISYSKRKGMLAILATFILIVLIIMLYSDAFYTKQKIYRKVGVIIFSKEFEESFFGLRDGMKNYWNKNIEFEVENIEGDLNKIKDVLEKFKNKKIKIIYATTTPVNLKIKELNKDYGFYILFSQVASPERSGIVVNEKISGTNFVGITRATFKISKKRILIFRDAFPNIRKLIAFYSPNELFLKDHLKEQKLFVESLGMSIELVPIVNNTTIENYIINNPDSSGIFMLPSAHAVKMFYRIKKLADRYRVPIMGIDTNLVDKGATIAYSQSFYMDGIQSAYFLNMLLIGIEPKDLPVHMPQNMELFINKKEIKKMERSFNPIYYSYADRVIE